MAELAVEGQSSLAFGLESQSVSTMKASPCSKSSNSRAAIIS
jgi:hypothetical protein